MQSKHITAIFLAALGTSACVSGGAPRWMPVDEVSAVDMKAFENEDAVVLLEEYKIYLNGPYVQGDFQEVTHVHRVIHIRTEDGFKHADVRVPYYNKGKVQDMSARTIAADGTITIVEPDRVFDDEIKKGELGSKAKVFTFPKVAAGSTIEYRYAIKYPWIQTYLRQYPRQNMPVLKYRASLKGTSDIRYIIRTSSRGLMKYATLDQKSSGFYLSWEMNDLPKAKKESYSGHRSHTQPWWSFNILAYEQAGNHSAQNKDWESAFSYTGKQLFDKKYYEKFEGKIDTTDCNSACKVERGVAWVDEHLLLRNGGGYNARTAREVMDAKEGNLAERSRILYKLLTDAGLTVEFAWTDRRYTNYFDIESPYRGAFNHLIVHLPKQEGIDAPMWVDPACPGCGPNVLRSAYLGYNALVLRPKKEGLGSAVKVEGELLTIEGTLHADHNVNSEILDIDIDYKTGSAKVVMSESWEGPIALVYSRDDSKKTDKERSDAAEEHIKRHAERAVLKSVDPITRQGKTMVTKRKTAFTLEGWVVMDGEQVILPLSILQSGFENDFKNKSRTTSVRVSETRRSTDGIRFAVPQGYEVVDLPKPVAVKTELFSVTMTAKEEAGVVTFLRTMEHTAGRADRKSGPKIKKVFDAVRDVETWTITLKKTPPPASAPSAMLSR